MKRYILILGLAVIIALCGCTADPDSSESDVVGLEDVYCDLDGNFQFVIHNKESSANTFDYVWTLNDPKADEPMYKGNGTITIQGQKKETLMFPVPSGLNDYDARFYIMYVYIYLDAEKIREYSEQKSPYDWDYSELPPVKLDKDRDHVSICFDTVITKNGDGDLKATIEGMSYNPPDSPTRLLLVDLFVTVGQQEFRTSSVTGQGSDDIISFHDADGNGHLSDGDYYLIPGTGNNTNDHEGSGIDIQTADPTVNFEWNGDTLKAEDPDGIIVKSITTDPAEPSTVEGLEFTIEVEVKGRVDFAGITWDVTKGRGTSRYSAPMKVQSQEGNNYTYSAKFEDLPEDKGTMTDYNMFYIEFRDHTVHEEIVSYLVEA